MGRSVSTPYGATVVAYTTFEPDYPEDNFEFHDVIDDARTLIADLFPSMRPDDGWAGREDRILASNGHAKFGVSEYCGLVAFWLVPEDTDLAATWCARVAPRFEAAFGTLQKMGHMSNGEGVFRRIGA